MMLCLDNGELFTSHYEFHLLKKCLSITLALTDENGTYKDLIKYM